MAITGDGMDMAEVTYCVVVDRLRGVDGSFAQVQFNLPWAFVRFGDVGEERRYVMSLDGRSVGLTVPGASVYRAREEVMRNSPFPYDDLLARGNYPTSDADALKGGTQAIHYFGGV